MNKEDLNNRLKELKENGYGVSKDLARELEYDLIEELLEDMKDGQIFNGDLENISNGLIEHIFEDHFRNNLNDYLEEK